MKWLFFTLLIGISGASQATVNLPVTCSDLTNPCPAEKALFQPGKPGLLVIDPAGAWELWESLAPTDQVRACPSDITPGATSCPAKRITLAKSEAAQEVVPWFARVSWPISTKDITGATLPAGEITGYRITWYYQDTPGVTLDVSATQSPVTIIVDRRPICAIVVAIGKTGESAGAPATCAPPPVVKITPMAVAGVEIN